MRQQTATASDAGRSPLIEYYKQGKNMVAIARMKSGTRIAKARTKKRAIELLYQQVYKSVYQTI